jgi:regulator of replication initiation timing
MPALSPEPLIAARRRDSAQRRQRVLDALDRLAAAGEELTASAVARAALVDRSFLYRHHDLRTEIIARAEAPVTAPTATTVSKRSLLADVANLRDQNQRLRHQNTVLTSRLSDALGKEVFHASGIWVTDDTEQLRTQIDQLEQQILDLRQKLEERADELTAARATNRDLMAELNGRHPR